MVSSPKSVVSVNPAGSALFHPLGFGVVGLGGYGKNVLRYLEETSAGINPLTRLAAVCDPDLEKFRAETAELRARNVMVYSRIEDLLADRQVQAVWLPVPINLHCKFTTAALEAGKAVMCEKPAAGTVDEVETMIAARDRSGLVVAIGFQDLYDPIVQDAKRRILAGELGKISSASVWGVWPRDSSYYGRNTWAGGMRRDGQWVLDSPASNAMAHFIMLLLYLLGPTQETAAVPVSIEAELYRANAIENYDTCGLRVTIESGLSVLILFTHAGRKHYGPDVLLVGEKGSLKFDNRESMTWTIGDHTESVNRPEPFTNMIRSFTQRVAGNSSATIGSLELARQHTVVINGASAASAVQDIPPDQIEIVNLPGGSTLHSVIGIESALGSCAAAGQLPHESGLFSWSKPASSLDLTNYRHFSGPRTR